MNSGPGTANGINNRGQISGHALLTSNGLPVTKNTNLYEPTHGSSMLFESDDHRILLGSGYAVNLNDSGNVIGTVEPPIIVADPVRSRIDLAES